jgi:hypothetical protein
MKSVHMTRRLGVTAIAALAAFAQACGGGDGITVTIPACTPVDLTFPGSVSGTTEDCTSGGFRAKVYRFTANANPAHGFGVASAFQNVGVEVTSDPQGTNNVVWVSTQSAVAAEWLLPPGNYLLRVTSRTGSGTFDLEGFTSTLNTTDCTVRTLVVGMTLTDHALAATDCEYLLSNGDPDGTYFDAYGILSGKPCNISLSSATMDTFLEVRNSQQAFPAIASHDDIDFAGGNTNSFLALPACNNNNGPIVIRANTATTTPATGSYTLVVEIVGGGSIVVAEGGAAPMRYDDLPMAMVGSGPAKTNPVKKAR